MSAPSFTVYAVWVRWCTDPYGYYQDHDVVAAFETKAQAYARMKRLDNMLSSYRRRLDRWFAAGRPEGKRPSMPPAAKEIIKRMGDDAELYVAPLKVTRGVK